MIAPIHIDGTILQLADREQMRHILHKTLCVLYSGRHFSALWQPTVRSYESNKTRGSEIITVRKASRSHTYGMWIDVSLFVVRAMASCRLLLSHLGLDRMQISTDRVLFLKLSIMSVA